MTATVDHLPYSDTNDADQWDPEPVSEGFPDGDIGVVPDHTAASDSPPVAEDAPRKRWPWERGGESSASDAPVSGPSRARGRKADRGDAVPALPRNFTAQLRDMYVTVGTMMLPFDRVCGDAIIQAAPKCAETLVDYAKTNADVRRILLKLVGTTAMGAIIAAHTPIIMAVAAHHIMPRFQKPAPAGPAPLDTDTALYPTDGQGMWSGN